MSKFEIPEKVEKILAYRYFAFFLQLSENPFFFSSGFQNMNTPLHIIMIIKEKLDCFNKQRPKNFKETV